MSSYPHEARTAMRTLRHQAARPIKRQPRRLCGAVGMKCLTAILAAMLPLAQAEASHALVRITDDRGGQIGRYVHRYEKLRASGQAIIIDGLCASACTIVLGAIPYDRICVTPNAELAFHGAWDFGSRGRAIPNPEATKELFSMYPSPVRRWIASRGGLSPRTIFLRGRQLAAMYRPCYLDARAAATRRIEHSVLANHSRRERLGFFARVHQRR